MLHFARTKLYKAAPHVSTSQGLILPRVSQHTHTPSKPHRIRAWVLEGAYHARAYALQEATGQCGAAQRTSAFQKRTPSESGTASGSGRVALAAIPVRGHPRLRWQRDTMPELDHATRP